MKKIYDYTMHSSIRRNENRSSKYQKYLNEFLASLEPNMYWQCDSPKEFESVRRAFRILVMNTDIIVRTDYNDLVVGFEYYDESID